MQKEVETLVIFVCKNLCEKPKKEKVVLTLNVLLPLLLALVMIKITDICLPHTFLNLCLFQFDCLQACSCI